MPRLHWQVPVSTRQFAAVAALLVSLPASLGRAEGLDLSVSVAAPGASAGCSSDDAGRAVFAALRARPALAPRARFVQPPASAVIEVCGAAGALELRGPRGRVQLAPGPAGEDVDAAAVRLGAALSRAARATNLLRVAGFVDGRGAITATVTLARAGQAALPVRVGEAPVAKDNDQVSAVFVNETDGPVDVTVFAVDPALDVSALFPAPGASGRVPARGRTELSLGIVGDVAGLESIVVVALPAVAGAPEPHLAALANPRKTLRVRGAGDDVAALVSDALDGGAATTGRGFVRKPDAGPQMAVFSWTIVADDPAPAPRK